MWNLSQYHLQYRYISHYTGMKGLNNFETLMQVENIFIVQILDGLVECHLEDQGYGRRVL
jgi:hypothetical protein